MSSSTPTLRKVAATSALALAATGALMATPASAAESAQLSYLCDIPNFPDPREFKAVHSVPETVQYGGTVPVTSTVVIPESVAGALYDFLGVRELEGSFVNYASALGAPLSITESFPRTAVPADGDMTVTADGGQSLAPFAPFTPAGTAIPVQVRDRAAQDGTEETDLDANVTSYRADGSSASFAFGCELADDQVLDVGTVTVVQAATETAAALAYKSKTGKFVGTAAVDAPESGAAAEGDVKFILKRNGKKVGAITVPLKDENAKASFGTKRKGDYKLVTKYLGTSNFEKSGGSATKSL